MYNEGYDYYLKDVLGVSGFPAHGPTQPPTSFVVCVPELSEVEQTLVKKILASIQLPTVEYKTVETLSVDTVIGLNANHVLSFVVDESFKAPEVLDLGSFKWWRFCSAAMMLSENETQNNERKKQVWTLLQSLKSQLQSE